MITLTDGTTPLTLNQVLWTNRAQSPGAAGSEHVGLAGGVTVQRAPGAGGSSIVLAALLEGSALRGWWTWAQVEQLIAWRDAGTELSLDYDGTVVTGVITAAGIDITPIKRTSNNPAADAHCAGTLTMYRIS